MSFIEFNPYLVLFWIFITSFIPGAMLALAILKKHELRLFEKIFIGAAIGLIIPALIAFLLNLAGIMYSFNIAIFSVLVFYIISIYLFWKFKGYEISFDFKPTLDKIVPFVLFIIMFLSFWIRLQAYSPVFHELDPYFYVYSAQQLLTLGIAPFEDKAAWYPEVLGSNHRTGPALYFMEAIWYSFYTTGGEYNNYLLALVSNVYPPLVSAFVAFFVYLLVASYTRRSYGIIAAALVSFMPIFVLKLAAGEIETQPYGFFTLSMFLGLYAIALKFKSKAVSFLAAIAIIALYTGSSSEVVGVVALIIFIPLQSILLFLREKDTKELYNFLIINTIVLVFGLFSGAFLQDFYGGGYISIPTTALFISLASLGFIVSLYIIKDKIKNVEVSTYAFVFLLLFGALLINFTPVGASIKGIALGTLGLAEYNYPLQRTIAEQPPAGSGDYISHLGTIGTRSKDNSNSLLNFLPAAGNTTFKFTVDSLNLVLGSNLNYTGAMYYSGIEIDEQSQRPKPVVFTHLYLLFFIMLFPISCLLAFFRHLKGEKNLFLLFLAIIFPVTVVGLLKAKFVIYLGFVLTIGISFIFAELELVLTKILKKLDFDIIKFEKHTFSVAFLILLTVGVVLSFAEFDNRGFPATKHILSSSTETRFQDNPLALQSKFKDLCSRIKIASGGAEFQPVCEASKDPIGYASKGINYQYNNDLCVLSVIKDPYNYVLKKNTNQPLTEEGSLEELSAAYRCQRVSDYWIESMEWIRYNTESDSRTTSWWDYGHWINFFGQKNTVLRNDHASTNMIGRVAHAYLHGSLDDLKKTMKDYDSKYALFDVEIAGAGIGGKYHALNYLGCAWANRTNVTTDPGTSGCEAEHTWENIYVPLVETPNAACIISDVSNKTGVMSFYGVNRDQFGDIIGLGSPVYCVGKTILANGQESMATYYLDRKYDNGELKLNKAIPLNSGSIADSNGNPVIQSFTMFYTKDPIWIENGEIKDGYEDRKGKYYDSNLYKAFFLKELPGFQLVYESSQRTQFGGNVKIYKLIE